MYERLLGVGSVLLFLLFLKSGVRAEPTVTLIFVGDVLLGRGVAQVLDGNWGAAFAEVAGSLRSADVAFANLESPLTTAAQISTGYDLRAQPGAVEALAEAEFDVVSIANNHAWDAGEEGLRQTARTVCQIGILPVGDSRDMTVVRDVDECQGVAVEGVRVLALDDSSQALDLDAAKRIVATAAESPEPLIVSVHWGGEYQAEPGPRQEEVAATLAASGAALIVGHGPHVPQPVEWVGDTLVAYSLGNFLFDQPYPLDCCWGTMLRVVFRGKRVIYVEAIPTATARGHVVLADGDRREAILDRLSLDLVRRRLSEGSLNDSIAEGG